MNSMFITNQKRKLSDSILNILPSTSNAFFLVGYFFFSGFKIISEALRSKKVRILIGMDVEKSINETLKEYYTYGNRSQFSHKEIRDSYFDSLKTMINDTDTLDNKDNQMQFKLFLNMIREGKLEIRKTREPNHAKLYLFENTSEHNQGGDFPGTVITGSSNLSFEGLQNRHEINAISRTTQDYNEMKNLFNELWEKSIELINENNYREFDDLVIQQIWIQSFPRPVKLYIKVLKEFFDDKVEKVRTPSSITNQRFFNVKYQIDAVKQALQKIERHTGVIIADVVGLGKSIIASTVAHNLGLKTLIISPPHLMRQWNEYALEFNFNAEVVSMGKLEDAQKFNNRYPEEKLIIIDEAHRFRNEETDSYGMVHEICQGNKVALLTATPFNNSPKDIFSLIKLFQIPSKSTVQTVDNLGYELKQIIAEYKKLQDEHKKGMISPVELEIRMNEISKKIRLILYPFLIRRSRLDLMKIDRYKEDLEKQGIEFPKVNPPKLLEYDLGELEKEYLDTLNRIDPTDQDATGFQAARYQPLNFIKPEFLHEFEDIFNEKNLLLNSQRQLANFMRRLLVRRFESSVQAFKQTLQNIITSYEKMQKWIDRGLILIFKKGIIPDVESFMAADYDDPDAALFEMTLDNLLDELEYYKEKGMVVIEKEKIKKEYFEAFQKDIELLKDIQSTWIAVDCHHDPKLQSLVKTIQELRKTKSGKKLILFSEFADTVNYVNEYLSKTDLRVFKYTSQESNPGNKEIIRVNFDASALQQKDDYDVLLATDAISEGFNLNRAGTILNYDMPWNPTRVIQRIGRINRINKKVFDELFIYHYFPTLVGEAQINAKTISTFKMHLIHAIMGGDTKILTGDENPQSYIEEQFSELMKSEEEESWDIAFRNDLDYFKRNEPMLFQQALEVPRRSRTGRKKKESAGVLIFAKRGKDHFFKWGDGEKDIHLNPELALQLFKASTEEDPVSMSGRFEAIYQSMKKNLFDRSSQFPHDKGMQKTLINLDYCIEQGYKKDYLEDLKRVVELGALPDVYMKLIRNMEVRDHKKAVDALQEVVTEEYIGKMIVKTRKVDDADQSLIIIEEFVK